MIRASNRYLMKNLEKLARRGTVPQGVTFFLLFEKRDPLDNGGSKKQTCFVKGIANFSPDLRNFKKISGNGFKVDKKKFTENESK